MMTRYSVFLLVFLLPLRNVVLKLQSIGFGINITYLLILLAALGIMLQPKNDAVRSLHTSKLTIPLTLYMFYFFCLTFLTEPGLAGAKGLLPYWKDHYLLPLIPFFLVTRAIQNRKDIVLLLVVMCLANIYMDTYFYRWVRWMNLDSFADKIKDVNGTFGEAGGSNEWAAFFSTYTLVYLAVIKEITQKWISLFIRVLAGCNILVLLFTFSRGGYLALCVGLLYLLVKMEKYFLVVVLLLLPVVYTVVLPDAVVERVEMSYDTTDQGQIEDLDIVSRLEMWKYSWEMIKASPIIGHGLKSFRFHHWNNPHNEHLHMLVQGGIVGYFIFLWLFVASYREAKYLWKNSQDPFVKGLGLGMMAAVISLLVGNLFGDRWSHYALIAYFWVLNGCVYFLINDTLRIQQK